MANELNLPLDPSRTGLTVTAILIQGNAQVGSAISCPESGTLPGHYSGTMPAVAEAIYGVRFMSAGAQVGLGVIDWDGAKERGLGDLPTVTQVEARTLPSADYFVVSDYTAPPTPATIWSYTGRTLDGIQATQIANIGGDTPGTVTLVSRLTSTRAENLDTIPNLLTAAAYTAPLTLLQTEVAVGDALIDYGTATAANVWGYSGRSLDGTQATQLANLDAAISTRLATADYDPPLNALETEGAVSNALTAYDVATTAAIVAIDSSLNALVALAQADEVISPTQYRKLAAGTNTAILTKAVTNDGAGNIQLRAAP